MNRIAKTDQVERFVATNMLAVTADRIFTQGKDASNNDIGTYSIGYMKQRARMNYPPSNKVILQATRQMTNDWSVISAGNVLGLGFKNSANPLPEPVRDIGTEQIFQGLCRPGRFRITGLRTVFQILNYQAISRYHDRDLGRQLFQHLDALVTFVELPRSVPLCQYRIQTPLKKRPVDRFQDEIVRTGIEGPLN